MPVLAVTVSPELRLISKANPFGLAPPAFPGPQSVLAVSVLVFPTTEILPVVDVIHALLALRVVVAVPGAAPVKARNFPLTLKVLAPRASLVWADVVSRFKSSQA